MAVPARQMDAEVSSSKLCTVSVLQEPGSLACHRDAAWEAFLR